MFEKRVPEQDGCWFCYGYCGSDFSVWKNLRFALMGCMRCQWDCPANLACNKVENLATLTEEETALVLSSVKDEKLEKQIVEKLIQYPYAKYFDFFRRNAQVTLKNLIKS